MPPVELKKDLTKDQIALLKRWITEGAEYEDHWAFSPPKRPLLVSSSDNWGNNPIDDFIFQQMTQTGLSPNKRAAKEILIRRVTLDLTGIPPTPSEIDAFLSDNSPDAYDRVVDRLLESP